MQIRERGSASPRRIALKATNLSEAKLAAEEKRREAREGDLPVRGRKPTLAELADTCLAIAATKKKPRTVKEDAHRLRRGKTTLGHVRVDLAREAGELLVDVTDDGVGLPPGFSLEGSNGLGLSIVHALVTSELNGSIEMHDDHGTRVHLRIPLRQAERVEL